MKRAEIFARDGYRCVYCGLVKTVDELSVDHVQPRVKGGDSSGGNVVTACIPCNTAKAARSLAQFLMDVPDARRNFFQLASSVWPRHLHAVEEEIARRERDRRATGTGSGYRSARNGTKGDRA